MTTVSKMVSTPLNDVRFATCINKIPKESYMRSIIWLVHHSFSAKTTPLILSYLICWVALNDPLIPFQTVVAEATTMPQQTSFEKQHQIMTSQVNMRNPWHGASDQGKLCWFQRINGNLRTMTNSSKIYPNVKPTNSPPRLQPRPQPVARWRGHHMKGSI